MMWSEVRKDYPNMWIVVEALNSDKQDDEKTISEVTVVNSFSDSIVQFGEMSYGFEIDGIIGSDLLSKMLAIIDFGCTSITSPKNQ